MCTTHNQQNLCWPSTHKTKPAEVKVHSGYESHRLTKCLAKYIMSLHNRQLVNWVAYCLRLSRLLGQWVLHGASRLGGLGPVHGAQLRGAVRRGGVRGRGRTGVGVRAGQQRLGSLPGSLAGEAASGAGDVVEGVGGIEIVHLVLERLAALVLVEAHAHGGGDGHRVHGDAHDGDGHQGQAEGVAVGHRIVIAGVAEDRRVRCRKSNCVSTSSGQQ
jgi:hypothetical protein